MLKPAPDGPAIVVCSSCRHSADARSDAHGQRGGAILADELRRLQPLLPDAAVIRIQTMACLFACTRHCTVHLRAPAKISYVLGDFTPTPAAARAIFDFTIRYAASQSGQVPYRQWPDGVKGHFLTRSPPAGFLIA